MKIIGKTIILPLLGLVILTSCSGSISMPAISPSKATETAITRKINTIAETQLVIPTATLAPLSFPTQSPIPPTQVPFFTFSVDRHDPESVIRAYFDAWERSDSTSMASVLFHTHGGFIFEPMNSLEIIEVQLISDSSPTERVYSVLYDVQWKVKEGSGQTRWNFYLAWDASRDSWFITNHGYR